MATEPRRDVSPLWRIKPRSWGSGCGSGCYANRPKVPVLVLSAGLLLLLLHDGNSNLALKPALVNPTLFTFKFVLVATPIPLMMNETIYPRFPTPFLCISTLNTLFHRHLDCYTRPQPRLILYRSFRIPRTVKHVCLSSIGLCHERLLSQRARYDSHSLIVHLSFTSHMRLMCMTDIFP